MTEQGIPSGYMRNALGHLVPEKQVRDHDKLRDQTVRQLAEDAVRIHKHLQEFKAQALSDIADLIAVSAERYDVALGGEKGNVSLTTYDGEYKITRSVAERLAFTEEVEAAKALISGCIERWSEGSSANLRTVVDRAFKANGRGQLKTTAVLDLLRLEIDDDEWHRAMEALRDSIQATGTAIYVRIYKRLPDTDEYLPVPLDLAAV